MAHFKAVIFDMDGTLTRPTLDFNKMREEIGLPPGDIAHEIVKLPLEQQQRAWQIIEGHEETARRDQVLQPGCLELLQRCREASVTIGLVTRNTRRSVLYFQEKHGVQFDGVISREFPFIKPHPGPILHLLESWGVVPCDTLMVGDYAHDIECGKAAGTATCFFHNRGGADYGQDADYCVETMTELTRIIFKKLP